MRASHPTTLPLAAILQAAPDALLVVDEMGTIVFANDAAAELFGAELVGRPIDALVPDEIRPDHVRHRSSFGDNPARRAMGRGRVLTARRGDGTTFPVDVGLAPVPGSDGLVTCVVRDLTDRDRAEHLARVQQVALESAANAIVITDRDGRIRWINPAFTAMTGWASDEVIGRNTSFLKSGQHDDAFYSELWTTITAGEVWHGELTNRRKDGSLYIEEQTIAPVRARTGEITHFIAVKQDVTERRRVAAALLEAKEAAEAAARAKTEFLANTSHELRTPLNAVIGLSELLLDSDLTARQRSMLETVHESGEALLALINDLLDLSKLEAGRLELDLHPVEVEPLFAAAIAQVAPRASAKGLELLWTLDRGLPAWVMADGLRVTQIVLNIVGNAVKFTERGEVIVRVSRADPGSPLVVGAPVRLRVSVRDTGIGIPEAVRHLLFRSFRQLDASSTRRFGGSGLGLSISKTLTEQMGGSITVSSEGVPGRGSCFDIELDLAIASPLGVALPVEPRLHGVRAAIAAEHAGLADALRSLLEGMGVEASVLDPDTDLERVEADVVIVDEALARALPRAGCVVLARMGSKLLDAFEAAPQLSVITKPVRPRVLRDVLLRAVRSRTSSGPPPRPTLAPRPLPSVAVLVAEDSIPNQKVITAQLARLGVNADVVGDGRAALAAIATGRYDLALVDVNMPGLDGLEVARAVRALDGAAASTVLVALTAGAMTGDRERCLAAGMDEYVSKPVRLPELEATIRRLCTDSGRRLRVAAAALEGGDDDVDRSIVAELRRDLESDAAFDDLVTTFLDSARSLLDRATEAHHRGDLRGVHLAAHTLKGSAQSCGAPALARVADEIERQAAARRPELVGAGLREARAAFERYRTTLARPDGGLGRR